MNERQGYYSIIQYSPVPERREFVNVGVALFSPVGRSVAVKVDPDISRIERVFGKQNAGQIKLLKEFLYNRLRSDFSVQWSSANIERFVSLRTGKIHMSSPLPILVKEPHADLENLFNELVGRSEKHPRAKKAEVVLKDRLRAAGVLDLVEKPEPVELPEGVVVDVPFGYQNGAYNFIDPIRLQGSPAEALKQVGSRAFEGEWLWNYSRGQGKQKKLVVVGDLSSQPDAFSEAVQAKLKQHHVGFYNVNNLDQLINDIRRGATTH